MKDMIENITPQPRVWSAPQLSMFGGVVELTASGSKGKSENENIGVGIICFFDPNGSFCKSRRP